MMTGTIGRLLRCAALAAVAGLAAGCASPQGPGSVTAPAGYGKDAISRVERLVQYCDRLAEKGEMVTALGLCARAHEIDPDAPEPLMKVAAILQAMNRSEAAVQTYGALLERHPKHHEAQYRLGKLYMEGGEAGLAALHFDRALRNNPEDPRAYNALGILRDQAGEHAAAQILYRQALERDPANFSVRNNLGLSLALDGKRDEAIEVLAELAVDPQAGQTVLRNLEAAYAARPVAPTAGAYPGASGMMPPAVPVEPVASEALDEGRVAVPAVPAVTPPAATTPAPVVGKQAPEAPQAGSPTPLFLPPAARSEERPEKPEQSGAHQPGVVPADPAGSAILAAAERLMAPPAWAEFEPGSLIRQQPASTSAPAAVNEPAPAAPSTGFDSPAPSFENMPSFENLPVFENVRARPAQAGAFSLSLLWPDASPTSA